MRILALDTAERSCGVAIVSGDALLAEMTVVSKQTHSLHLMEMTDTTLRMAQTDLSEIKAFAVGQGPGSFTGLRIGFGVVKGLASACGKPVIGISDTDVLAAQCSLSSLQVCVMTDARRSEVYTCRYRPKDGKLHPETEIRAVSPEEAIAGIAETCLFVGSGALLYREMIRKRLGDMAIFAPEDAHIPRAATIARLAAEKFRRGDTSDAATFVPLYVRKPEFRMMSAC